MALGGWESPCQGLGEDFIFVEKMVAIHEKVGEISKSARHIFIDAWEVSKFEEVTLVK